MSIDLNGLRQRAGTVVRGAVNLGKEAVGEAADAGRTVANVVKHVPDTVDTWKGLAHAARTGERTRLPGEMPAYVPLPAAAKAGAVARGQGRTLPQGFLENAKAGGSKHEPVTLMVTGSKQQLAAALRKSGWVEAAPSTPGNYIKQALAVITRFDRVTEGPVSNMYLDGKLPDLVFSKNSDFNLARDHMRVYQVGPDRWAIAATRDTAATVTLPHPEKTGKLPWDLKFKTPGFGHETDPDLDGERDLIMNDLLASGLTQDWAAVNATRPADRKVGRAPDGRLTVDKYTTDGRIYDVKLAP